MKNRPVELTEAEWAIIKAVWGNEPCTAPQVEQRLRHQTPWTCSTVRTLMDRMVAKGQLMTLGLVGILESRNALRQHIERLLDFRPPPASKVPLVSLLAVLAFAAVAVPMGEPPAPERNRSPGVSPFSAGVTTSESRGENGQDPAEGNRKAGSLVQDGKLLHEMGKLDEAQAQLSFRTIGFDPYTFGQNLRTRTGLPDSSGPGAELQALRNLLRDYGVDLTPPTSVFYKGHRGAILVYASPQQLGFVERLVQELNPEPTQVQIEAEFLEVDAQVLEPLLTLLAPYEATNRFEASAKTARTVILPPEQAHSLRELASQSAAKVLNAAVSTLSGRQGKIQTADWQSLATDINPKTVRPPGVATRDVGQDGVFTLEPAPVGPQLFIDSAVCQNGLDVLLTVIKDLTQNSALFADVTVRDSYTLVLSKPVDTPGQPAEGPATGRNRFLVLVTARIRDHAGNRLHTDEEIRFLSR